MKLQNSLTPHKRERNSILKVPLLPMLRKHPMLCGPRGAFW